MNSGILKKAIPHIVAVLTFIVLSYAFFYPVLEGKQVNAADTKVFAGASKEIQDFRKETGKEPLWTNSMFGGMPAFLISAKFPGNLFKQLDLFLKIFKTPVAALFLAFLGFYIMLLLYDVKPWLALVGALAYGFTSFLFASLSAGHNTKVYAMAYMAPIVGSVIYTFRKNALKGAILFSFFLTLQIIAGHLQITYYTFMILVVFGIWEIVGAIRNKALAPFFKALLMLIAGAVISVGVNFGTIYTTWEYAKESTRGKSDLTKTEAKDGKGLDKEYITQWSYGVDETLTLLIPNFRGGPTEVFKKDSETLKALRKNNMSQYSNQLYGYWGRQPSTSGPVYFGAIVLFLFIIGMIIVPSRDKWWLLTAVLVSIFLAWGKNMMFFTSLFVDFFPGYNKFRAVTMILVIAGVCVPFVSILALREIIEGKVSASDALRAIKISAGITGGLAFLFFLIPGLAGSFISPNEASLPNSFNWLKEALAADRKMMLRADAIRSALLIIAGAAVLWLFLKNKVKPSHAVAFLAVLILADLMPVDSRYMNSSNFETKRESDKSLAPSTADKVIMQDKSEYRVLNLSVSTFNDASTSYYHKSIGGYHGAKLKRYQELIETNLSTDINTLISKLQKAETLEEVEGIMPHLNSLNMLNTKYIIISPDAPPLVNNSSLGSAWLVEKATIVDNADTELAGIKNIDPSTEALVDKRFADAVTVKEGHSSPSDTVYLSLYQPNHLVYEADVASDRVAVFSEIYYPYGWNADIDGKPARIFRTDYVLRGMVIPAGKHTITFNFESQSYKTGNKVSLASSFVLILLLLYAGISGLISSKKNE